MTQVQHHDEQSSAEARPGGLRVRPFLERTADEPAVAPPCANDVYLEVGRLTASLLESQQVLLDSLERDELDPDRLEQLFALDHLAALVRRQADTLCALADGPTVRSPEELSLDDLLHAAESSVPDYRRVEIEPPARGRVAAAVAGDMVHLITEVLDLALVTSGDRVFVSSRIVGEVAVIGVRDGGPVPAPEELDAALAVRIPRPEGLPTSARLLVIERLAQRHDVRVDLRPGPHGGMVGSIVLPSATLVAVPEETGAPEVDDDSAWATVVTLAKADATPPSPRHRREGPALDLTGRAV
jgi:hypothetical protein